MKKNLSLLITAIISTGSMVAQTEGTMTALLPDGVKASVTQEKRFDSQKNICVAGSPTKGYYAFFAATDSEHGEELWITDGTPEGTRLVKDINPGISTSNIEYLTRFNDKVVFSANDGENGTEPWISDGTEEGTFMLKDIHEMDSSNPIGFCQMSENEFIFYAMDFESELFDANGSQKWLYVSDGTTEGTRLVKQVDCQYPGENVDYRYGQNMRVGRRVYFKGDVADKTATTYGYEIWVTDGTEEGTYMVKDINLEKNVAKAGSTLSSSPAQLQNFYNEKLFFKAWDEDCGNEPWATDGTEENTYMIFDTNASKGENGIGNGGGVTMTGEVYNGKVYFRGWSDVYGCELGSTNCEKGDYTCYDIFTTEPTLDNSSFADDGVVFDNLYMFCAATGFDANIAGHMGGELHWCDGEKVQIQYDFAPGVACDWVKELTVAGGSLYWWNEGSIDGTGATTTKLLRLDAWDGIPTIVSNIDANGDQIHTLRNLNGDLLFTSMVTNQIYCYHYRQPNYDPEKNPDVMEPEYRTREEIENGTGSAMKKTVSEKGSISAYPAIASDMFKLKGVNGSCDIQIYDIAGRLHLDMKNVAEGKAISISNLSAGFYKVVVTAEGTTQSTSLIVK